MSVYRPSPAPGIWALVSAVVLGEEWMPLRSFSPGHGLRMFFFPREDGLALCVPASAGPQGRLRLLFLVGPRMQLV